MADIAHERTEEILNDLRERIAEEYAKAVEDMQKKYIAWAEQFAEQETKQKALLEAGKITQDDYSNWRFRHEAIGKRWEKMRDVLAEDLENARNISLKISGEKMPDVYVLNANYATWQIEHDGSIDTGFTLYNHDAAEYLLADTRQLMPGPSTKKALEIAKNKSMQWDKQKIQSAVLQGILQGESPYKIAERLRGVAEMDYNASVRYARTMTTSAQNAGRYESFRRAKKIGVDLTIEWQATLDDRTRAAHRYMHGQRTTVDEPFSTPDGYTIYYPADCTGESDAPQREIWNCRCTLLAWVKGFEGDTIKSSPKMGDKSFDEWQHEKKLDFSKPSTTQENRKTTEEERKKQLDNSTTIQGLRQSKIKRIEPKHYSTIPTDEEIVKRVCGGDETKGSCMSLSFAYAGNKNGFEVLDFRGGESQNYFSSIYGWEEIAKRLGVEARAKTQIACAEKLLSTCEIGKEYILIVGKHASVVRRLEEKNFEYLELQEELGGWVRIGTNTLKNRFGCRKTPKRNPFNNEVQESSANMIDIENLKGDSVFEEMLCYINTPPEQRKSGKNGYAK